MTEWNNQKNPSHTQYMQTQSISQKKKTRTSCFAACMNPFGAGAEEMNSFYAKYILPLFFSSITIYIDYPSNANRITAQL